MEFSNKTTGAKSPIPWTPEESKALGYARYMDENGCPNCGQHSVGRYVTNNYCVNCALNEAAELWKLWVMGSPDRPEMFPRTSAQAVEMGVEYYYREQLCKGGRHFVQPHIKTGRCVACASLKSSVAKLPPDTILSKSDAAALGFDVYRTGEPCRRGHKGFRYVSNGGCIECMRGSIQTPTFERVDMDKRVSVAEQAQLFIGHAWDGRRIVDPDGTRLTVAQFNIMVGGVGRYEVSGGRPDVFTSHQAFMLNFGPLRAK